MTALSDALAELATASAKVAALSGDADTGKPGWNDAQAAENIRAGVAVNDGVVMARLRSGQIAHDGPEFKAALAADRRADREAAARAEVQRRHGKGAAKGAATGNPDSPVEQARAEIRRRYGNRSA